MVLGYDEDPEDQRAPIIVLRRELYRTLETAPIRGGLVRGYRSGPLLFGERATTLYYLLDHL